MAKTFSYRLDIGPSEYSMVEYSATKGDAFLVLWKVEGARTKSVRWDLRKGTVAGNYREIARRVIQDFKRDSADADADDKAMDVAIRLPDTVDAAALRQLLEDAGFKGGEM